MLSRTCGRIVAKSVNSSGLISARGAAPRFSTRCLTAVLAASAASFQPVKAAMTWGRRNSGRRIQRTCSRSAIDRNDTAQNGVRNQFTHTTLARLYGCIYRIGRIMNWPNPPSPVTSSTRLLSYTSFGPCMRSYSVAPAGVVTKVQAWRL